MAQLVAARASTLLELNRSDEAIKALLSGLAEFPDQPALLDVLARAQLKLDPHAAAETAGRLIAVAPDSHRGFLLGSHAHMRLHRRRMARRLAELAVERAPHSGVCHAQLAQSMAGQPLRYRRAKSAARTALELAPTDPDVHVAAGNVALGIGWTRRAGRHYRSALELDPTHSIAQTNRAIVRHEHGNTAKALKELSNALQVDPQNAQTRRAFDAAIYRAICDLLIVWIFVNCAVTVLRA
jgi:tetratricopeptide (TPR) repeat protein